MNAACGVVRVGAAAYSALSALPLVFLLVASRGWLTERATVLSTTKHDGRAFDGFGLTYDGAGGTMLLWAQLVIVLVAIGFSFRPGPLGVCARAAMCVWALFLLGNTLWVVLAGGYLQVSWLIAVAAVGGALTGADLALGIRARRAPLAR